MHIIHTALRVINFSMRARTAHSDSVTTTLNQAKCIAFNKTGSNYAYYARTQYNELIFLMRCHYHNMYNKLLPWFRYNEAVIKVADISVCNRVDLQLSTFLAAPLSKLILFLLHPLP